MEPRNVWTTGQERRDVGKKRERERDRGKGVARRGRRSKVYLGLSNNLQ